MTDISELAFEIKGASLHLKRLAAELTQFSKMRLEDNELEAALEDSYDDRERIEQAVDTMKKAWDRLVAAYHGIPA